MNFVEFKIIPKHDIGTGRDYEVVDISVDEKPLAEIMKAHEMPFAEAEGHPELAGDYHAMNIVAQSLEEYFLGCERDAWWGDDENKTLLLGCSCGETGCWPLLCKITVEEEKVIWSGFEQWHRCTEWDYSNVGFVFDKQQYINALEKIKAR